MIEINNLTKFYGDLKAVDDITLQVDSGQIYGFVGKNGAGKSTTIRAMLNMIFPTKGSISINGYDSVNDAKEIKRLVSYMASEVSYAENATAKDIFTLIENTCSDINSDKIAELSNYFELDINKKIANLSLGNKKKVAIIACLIRNSDVIILDEPTSGLDPLMQQRFFGKLLEKKSQGKTIFLSSHNLNEVEKYCDKVAIIKDGKIMEVLDMDYVIIKRKQMISYTLKDKTKKSYIFDGDINDLLKDLAKLDIMQLEIKNQSIEDEFINYFRTKVEK